MRLLLGRRELRRQSLTLVQRLDCHGMFAFAPFVIFFARVSLFLLFRSVAVPSGAPTSMHSTQQQLRGLLLLLYL